MSRASEVEDLVARAPRDADVFAWWVAHNVPEHLKIELSSDEISVVQAGASGYHNRVCQNLVREIERHINLAEFEAYHADFAVRTPVGIRYPDVVLLPVLEGKQYDTREPLFTAEVLSPSSPGIDFVDKRLEYLKIHSLQTYMICAQDEPRLWFWTRQADGTWPLKPEMRTGRDDVVPLGDLNIALSMAAIFRGIPDAPAPG